MSDDDFLAAFEDCRISMDQWNHEAHVRMAWLYLRRMPVEVALPIVRQGLQRYSASLGKTGAYHETITVAFLELIGQEVAREPEADDFAGFSRRHPRFLDRSMSVLLEFYSRDRLFSHEARARFVEPDLATWDRVERSSRVVDFKGLVG